MSPHGGMRRRAGRALPVLDDQMRRRIVSAYRYGTASYRELAGRFGVSEGLIGKVLAQAKKEGQLWREDR